MAKRASEKAAEYDRLYPDSISDYAQKVERQERIDLRRRKAEGGRGTRFFGVPALPWHRTPEEN